MKLPDLNVLLNARDEAAPHHETAKRWLLAALSGTETVGFAWVVLLGFVRLSTNPRAYAEPLAVATALGLVDGWLERSVATVVNPGRRHWALLYELIESAGTAANLTTDAHLAALAIEHGATLSSFDGDFHRFSGLDLEYLASDRDLRD